MDDFTFDTDLFAEINDMQAEIFDVIEDEKFDVEEYIKGDTDYWHLVGEQFVTPRSAARPVGRLAQATLRFSFGVLYHSELPNPAGYAIILVWKQKHFSPLLKPCKIFRILCLTLWHHLRWQSIGSAIVSMSTPMMMSSTSFLMLTMLSSVTDNNARD